MKGGAQELIPLIEELLIVDVFWRRKSQFSLRVWPLVGCHTPVSLHTIRSMWEAQTVLDGFKTQAGFKVGSVGKEMGDEENVFKIEHMKFLQN